MVQVLWCCRTNVSHLSENAVNWFKCQQSICSSVSWIHLIQHVQLLDVQTNKLTVISTQNIRFDEQCCACAFFEMAPFTIMIHSDQSNVVRNQFQIWNNVIEHVLLNQMLLSNLQRICFIWNIHRISSMASRKRSRISSIIVPHSKAFMCQCQHQDCANQTCSRSILFSTVCSPIQFQPSMVEAYYVSSDLLSMRCAFTTLLAPLATFKSILIWLYLCVDARTYTNQYDLYAVHLVYEIVSGMK